MKKIKVIIFDAYGTLFDVNSAAKKCKEKIGERGIKISGGQFQRINLARALYHKPSILIMDEATSALDNETERKILDTVLELNSKENLTVILISHKLENLKSCNRKFLLDNKNLIEQ